MRICCIGAGYVGAPTMATIALNCPEITVTVVDICQGQIDAWNSTQHPIYEPGLFQIVERCKNKNLFFSVDIDTAILEADIIFVAVNTPTKMYGHGAGCAANLKNWELAARNIGKVAKTNKIVVEKSTVPVCTAAAMKRVMENSNGCGVHFEVLSNPEFLAEGTAVSDLQQPDRVLIGGHDTPEGKEATDTLAWVYKHWVDKTRIITTNVWSSELSKLAANALLAQRISSVNMLSALCESVGADVTDLAVAVGSDSRIGNKFLSASVGFGGSCFRKDVLNLVYLCESYGLKDAAAYWMSVVTANEYQKRRFTQNMISSMFSTVNGKKLAIFGFAFKKDTGDTRDTPAIGVCHMLLKERATLSIYDPKVSREQVESDLCGTNEDDGHFSVATDPYECATGAHAIALLTEWDEFVTLDFPKLFSKMKKPAFIFDGRNILPHDTLRKVGFQVYAIGK